MSAHGTGGGGGGGGGGGSGGGTGVTPGGVDGAPGGGTGGGTGLSVSGWTHADRSKNKNSSAFSCALRVTDVQPVGKGVPPLAVVPGLDWSFFSPDGRGAAFTWRSVWTRRPHCISVGASTGVLKVMYWVEVPALTQFGFDGR